MILLKGEKLVIGGKEFEKNLGKKVFVSLSEEDISFQITKKGNSFRTFERVLRKGKKGRYYVKWNKLRLFVGKVKRKSGKLEPIFTAYEQDYMKSINDEYIFSSDLTKEEEENLK